MKTGIRCAEADQLAFDEGLRLKLYRCSKGKITIGIGRNLEDNPLSPDEAMVLLLSRPHIKVNNTEISEVRKLLMKEFSENGITKNEALYLFENDINKVIMQLTARLPWFKGLPEEVKNILINMTFQMGIGDILTFKNTLRSIQSGDYKEAAVQMKDSLWYYQTPARAERLIKRMENIKGN